MTTKFILTFTLTLALISSTSFATNEVDAANTLVNILKSLGVGNSGSSRQLIHLHGTWQYSNKNRAYDEKCTLSLWGKSKEKTISLIATGQYPSEFTEQAAFGLKGDEHDNFELIQYDRRKDNLKLEGVRVFAFERLYRYNSGKIVTINLKLYTERGIIKSFELADEIYKNVCIFD